VVTQKGRKYSPFLECHVATQEVEKYSPFLECQVENTINS